MELKDKKIGFILTGSFCTFEKTILEMKKIAKLGGILIPIMSFNAYKINTRFGKAEEIRKQIEQICNNKIINTIEKAEPIGPKNLTDIMVIAPATGNTISKLSYGITDTPALMAANTHLFWWQM